MDVPGDTPVETGMARAGKRNEPDRFEAEHSEFFMRVREAYLRLAEAEPERFVVVDATRELALVKQDIGTIAEAFLQS